MIGLLSADQAMSRSKPAAIPADVYIQFVRSLFNSVHTVLVGAFIHGTIGFLVYWHDRRPVYLVLALLLLVVGTWRYLGMLQFSKSDGINNRAEAAAWEGAYIFRGTIQALTIGTFCFVSVYVATDPFAEFAANCVALGSLVTVAGRNYGSSRMVTVFGAAFLGPLGLGLILRGDIHNIILGIIIFIFFFIVRSTANQVREVLFSAVIGHRKAKQLAKRFDRALNTMPHGLVMLGADGRVVVANAEAAQLLSARSPEVLVGRSLRSLIMRAAAAGLLQRQDCSFAIRQLTSALHESRDRKLLLKFTNGRYFEFSTREGPGDLGVITFEDVTNRVEVEEKVRFMARYDSLTGLPNRAYFHELVAGALVEGDRGRTCGLAVFDLDDFKSVNDTLGHPVGDGLIYAIAERLAGWAKGDVKVGRFGGDEFMVFFDQVESGEQFGRLLDALFESLQGDIDVAGHALHIQCSAGAVMGNVAEMDVDAMIIKADLALYKAKELGKNNWCLFETSMDEAFRNKQMMMVELRAAIEAGTLRVVYQPIVSMTSMQIESCEALCRWDHPELGAVSPAVFIPLAEEMGIISKVSAFVLATACAACAKWPEQISVSVNLSAKDFRSRQTLHAVEEVLKATALAPHRLVLEVTETALLDDKSATRDLLSELKEMGVKIALDDFGTGYSSLSYLHTLPLDKIKIDRSFLMDVTRNKRSLELLRGIVDLSHSLGLGVIMEGVETFEQLKILASRIKPDLLQGFLFGSALTASGIDTMSLTVWPFAEEISASRRAARR